VIDDAACFCSWQPFKIPLTQDISLDIRVRSTAPAPAPGFVLQQRVAVAMGGGIGFSWGKRVGKHGAAAIWGLGSADNVSTFIIARISNSK